MNSYRWITVATIAVISFAAALFGQYGEEDSSHMKEQPRIEITIAPPMDSGGPYRMALISGTVSGAQSGCRVVVFAYGDVWYVQPYTASPFTQVGRDGKWRSETHLGMEYAALLVTPGYRPPNTAIDLPREDPAILAIARVRGK